MPNRALPFLWMKMKINRTVKTGLHSPRTRIVVAVDPGTYETAFVLSLFSSAHPDRVRILHKDKIKNAAMIKYLKAVPCDIVVCEEIQSYGMRVSGTVFDTVRFVGRLEQITSDRSKDFLLLGRRDIKTFVGLPVKCKDADVRRRMIAIYGEQGTKRNPGPTYGFSADMWAALAVAHALRELFTVKKLFI